MNRVKNIGWAVKTLGGDGWGDGGFVWADYEAFDNVFDLNNPFRVLCQAFVGLN
ncbi:hypothetical protein [Algoriphagus sp.]|uniref:hypothetical protein n=1 Tax=Algoriphagus sp. TaxID=1872435 RepID=UPI00391B6B50